MTKRGGQPGNTNNTKGRKVFEALHKQLAQYERGGADPIEMGQALDKICKNIVKMAVDEDKWAIEFIADRMDGKPKQTAEIEHTGSVAHEHSGLQAVSTRLADLLGERTPDDPPALPTH